MLSQCPVCTRQVAHGEKIARTTAGIWCHTACATGDGPTIAGPIITNHLHYYVSVGDPENSCKRGVLLGPFPDYDEANRNVNKGRELAQKADPWAAFCMFGVCSSNHLLKTVFDHTQD
jgi:hypothetical protein